MKNYILLTITFLCILIVRAQQFAPPQGINYQAVAIDNDGQETVGADIVGKPVANKEIRVRFSILKDNETGNLTFREVHLVKTDAYGLFNTVIGLGIIDASPNTFDQIDWGTGFHFLKVEIDITGGTNFKDMGTQQLWSVPYALYSKYAGIAGNGIEEVIDNGDGTLTFTYVDGSTYTTSPLEGLTGPQGPQGPQGDNGPQGPIGLTGPAGAQGIPGTNGLNGKNTLVKTTLETPGSNCNSGGVKIEYGLDDNNNGVLESTEINAALTKYVCNGAVGANGATGPQGLTGPAGPAGPQGIQGPAGPQGIQGPSGALNAWSLTGNGGTNPITNFIGTTDAQDWVVKTNNTERLRLLSNGNFGIGTSSPASNLVVKSPGFQYEMSYEGSVGPLGLSLLKIKNPYNDNNDNQANLILEGFSGNLSVENHHDGNTPSNRYTALRNTTQNKFFYLTNSGNAALTLDQIGNMGIYNNSPSQRFVVNTDSGIGVDSTVVITSVGNVGIGAPNPTSKLQIGTSDNLNWVGQFSNAGGSGYGLLVRSGSPTSNIPVLEIQNNSQNPIFSVRSNSNVGVNTNNPLGRFHVSNDITGTDSSFVVTAAGDVGIGTNNPVSQFMVKDKQNAYWMNYTSGIGGFSHLIVANPYNDNNDNQANLILQGFSGNLSIENHHDGNTPSNKYTAIRNTTQNKFHYINNLGQNSLTIDVAGNMGLNTVNPSSLLSVNGAADKIGGGTWLTFSDARVKTDIKPFNDGLELLMKLNPVSFRYNERSGYSDHNQRFIGFIAQDVELVAPYMVSTYDDSNGPSGLNDKRQFDESALSKIMINAIKEQQLMIDQQARMIEELIKRVESLEKN